MMLTLYGWCLAYVTLIGLAVGSFLNVVIFRLHTGRSLSGRSACLSCARRLPWYDLLPVISFIALRAKCRACSAKISWQYPSVELLTAILFFFLAWQFFQTPFGGEAVLRAIFSILAWPILVVILVYDFRHKIIPDSLSYSLAVLSFFYRVGLGFLLGFDYFFFFDLAAGPILFIPFFLLWRLSNGKWMGLGDGKLALSIGWIGGLGGGISGVAFGFWAGALVGIVLITFTYLKSRNIFGRVLKGRMKTVTMKSELPFAPFLIAGLAAVQFFGFSLFNFGL